MCLHCFAVGNELTAETPDIDLGVVPTLALDKLRRHPAHCPHFARPSISLSSQLSRVAKVCKFDLPLLVHQNIVTFYVSMNYVPFVQIVQTKKSLPKNILASIL